MKKFNKNFTVNILVILVVLLLAVVLENIIADPFCIFTKTTYGSVKNKKILPNERFLKMKYILQNPNKYDSFLIGSCTSNFMNLDSLTNGKWYNLTYTNNNIYEMNRSLKILLANNVNIKRVLVQISIGALKAEKNEQAKVCNSFINLCSYPQSKIEKLKFYSRYLFYFPFIDKNKYNPFYEGSKENIFKGGSFTGKTPDNEAEMIPSKKELFRNYDIDNRDYEYFNVLLLKEMADLCKKSGIEFDLFIIPEYIEIYLKNDIAALNDVKRELLAVSPFYDFSGINEISKNQKYFIDPGHINDWASKLIKDRIFHYDKYTQPKIKGYGVYVTKDNISEHLNVLNKEISDYNLLNK